MSVCDCKCEHKETKPPCRQCYGEFFTRRPDGTLVHIPVKK